MFPPTIDDLIKNITEKETDKATIRRKKENALCLCQVIYDNMLEDLIDSPQLLDKTFNSAMEICAMYYIPGYKAKIKNEDLGFIKHKTKGFRPNIKYRYLSGS